jgi:ABC-type bacteriocin/lantibiotic exporter with double-glycine peptidase domain
MNTRSLISIRPRPSIVWTVVVMVLAVGLAVQMRSAPGTNSHPAIRVADPSTSCGPVSLVVVSELLGKPLTISECHVATGAGEAGTCSMKDLLHAVRTFGFSAKAVRYDRRRPPVHRLPMILFVDGSHFLTAVTDREGNVILIDPPLESKSVAWSDLYPRWRGEAIVVGLREQDVTTALEKN